MTSYQDRLITRVSVETGLRTSDVIRLTKNNLYTDIDDNGIISTTEKKTHKKKVCVISNDLYADLFDFRPSRADLPLFCERDNIAYYSPNTSIGRTTYYKRLKRVSTSLGIDMSPHSLRYLYARNLYDATHSIRAVQEALNHKYVTTTAGYLGLDLDELIRQALNR